jgi:MFS superfamily sulfate permease-like transporter
LQLGTAVQLIIKAHNLAAKLQWKITAGNWADNNTWVLLSFMFVVLCYRTRVPSALILFLIGLLFALILMFVENAQVPRPSVMGGHYPDMVIVPSPTEFKDGFLNAGLGQLPLTALNSVIALCALIHDLFPDNQTSTSGVAMSVGLMNLIGCWFGAMPVCHGSGGLAGQYRFGARSEVSVILLGLCKLILGILFGSSVVGLLQLFPNSILAVMMFISGVELGCSARSINDHETDDTRKRENFTLMLLTAGALVAYSNDGIGFVTGLVSAILLSVQRLGVREWWHQLSKGIRSIPQRWISQRDYSEGRANTLPESQEERVSVVIKKSPGYGSQQNPV